VALFKTDYKEGRLQPTPAGHPKGELLSTGLEFLFLIPLLSLVSILKLFELVGRNLVNFQNFSDHFTKFESVEARIFTMNQRKSSEISKKICLNFSKKTIFKVFVLKR
jgi:hypothetical protein